MKNVIASIVAAAGLASLAAAQASHIDIETSLDGLSWSTGVRNVNPNTTVQTRVKVTFLAQGTTTIPVGFATMTFQPTVSNWDATAGTGDSLAAFATVGNNTNGGAVLDQNGVYGRILPFGATGPATTDPYRGLTQTVSGTSYLRIARSTITNWVGDGPTTTTSAVNNFNGSGGLACVQKSSGNVGTADPAFNANITNVILFKFGMTTGTSNADRTLVIDIPLAGINRNTATGAREAAWFTSGSDNFGGLKAAVDITGSSLHIIPAPGALGMLGLGGLVVLRRRR